MIAPERDRGAFLLTTSSKQIGRAASPSAVGDLSWARGPLAGVARATFLKVILAPVIQHYGHTTVTGLENLKGIRPPFLLAANHASHLDAPAILLALPSRLRRRTLVAAAADYFFDSPWKGTLVALAVGAIAVERRRASRTTLRALRGLLTEGWSLVVFPEGGRSLDGKLHGGKRGIAHLAVAAGVPVIPVGVLGTFAAMPTGKRWPTHGQLEVRFGSPLMPESLDGPSPGAARLREATNGIMASIQALTEMDGPQEEGKGLPSGSPRPVVAAPAWHWY